MIELDGIALVQNQIPVYLTKVSVKQLRDLEEKKILRVARYQKGEGYQRVIDEKRINDISKFISGYKDDKLIWPILASSVIINIPDKNDIDYKNGKIIIKNSAKMNIVDGQHRVYGLINSKLDSFELPVSIIAGLDEFKEAAQFLIINTKQKKVRPDLVLTVLHDINLSEANLLIEKLKKVLGVDEWQMEATNIAIQLNNIPGRPWYNLMLRPNESRNEEKKRGRVWVPVNQASFVDTLRTYCQQSGSLQYVNLKMKEEFLTKMWNLIKNKNPDAFDPENGKRYMLTNGAGIGPLNTVAPLLFHLDAADITKTEDAIDKIFRKFRIEQWKKDGKIGRSWGTSQKEFKTHALELANIINPELDFIDQKIRDNYMKKVAYPSKGVIKALSALNPLVFRAETFLEKDLKEKNPGCYCLLSFWNEKPRIYVGQAKDVKQRLNEQKKRVYRLYSFVSAKKEELNEVESALYHLIKEKYRINTNHPPKKEDCEFCRLL